MRADRGIESGTNQLFRLGTPPVRLRIGRPLTDHLSLIIADCLGPGLMSSRATAGGSYLLWAADVRLAVRFGSVRASLAATLYLRSAAARFRLRRASRALCSRNRLSIFLWLSARPGLSCFF